MWRATPLIRIDRSPRSEPLLAANVPFRGLNAFVAEQGRDVFDLATGVVAVSCARAPEIMGSDTGQTTLGTGRRHHGPDHF